MAAYEKGRIGFADGTEALKVVRNWGFHTILYDTIWVRSGSLSQWLFEVLFHDHLTTVMNLS